MADTDSLANDDSRIIEESIKIQNENWIKSYWRPSMGWLYMLICFCDFVLFPALTMVIPAVLKTNGVSIDYTPWTSLTLSNGGIVHVAFGAICGVSAWSRTRDKLQ